MKTRPLASVAIPFTGPSAPEPGLKVASSEPSVFSRATKLRFVPLTTVKRPPINTLPSGWICTAKTALSGPVPTLKDVSKVPSAFNRARFVRTAEPTKSKAPPMITLPTLVVFV